MPRNLIAGKRAEPAPPSLRYSAIHRSRVDIPLSVNAFASEIGDSAWLGDEAMSQRNQLREALERSKKRRAYRQKQLQDFASSADLSDTRQKRTCQKLRDDLTQAESDVRSIQRQLDDLMD